ncbi:MAG TPA: hypothetical protein VFA78_01300 [Chloroflexota bacterium]|nr:hypothetical protein [Chloroflexota bacterium]
MNRRAGLAILAAALAALILVWTLAPPLTPPLYDGISLPAQPYRYLSPPKGTLSTKPPTSAREVLAAHGKAPQVFISTKENPPQAILAIDSNGIKLPAGTTHVTISIKPVPAPAQPSSGTLDGNVYLFEATNNAGRSLTLTKHAGAQVELREPGTGGHQVVEQYVGKQWHRRNSATFVNAQYQASNISSLGYYSLVTVSASGSSTGGIPILAIVGGIIVLFVVGILLVLRGLRTGRTGAH